LRSTRRIGDGLLRATTEIAKSTEERADFVFLGFDELALEGELLAKFVR